MLWSMYADPASIYNPINRLLPPPPPADPRLRGGHSSRQPVPPSGASWSLPRAASVLRRICSTLPPPKGPKLCVFYRNLAGMAPAIPPHPDVELSELVQPAAVPSTRAGVRHCPVPVPDFLALHQRNPAQDIGGGADVEARLVPAACGVVEHGHTTALHKPASTLRPLDGE